MQGDIDREKKQALYGQDVLGVGHHADDRRIATDVLADPTRVDVGEVSADGTVSYLVSGLNQRRHKAVHGIFP